MDSQQPQSSPHLNLTDIQRTILQAHISDAVASMIQVSFHDPEKWKADICQFVFQKGRMQMATALLGYDAEMTAQARAE